MNANPNLGIWVPDSRGFEFIRGYSARNLFQDSHFPLIPSHINTAAANLRREVSSGNCFSPFSWKNTHSNTSPLALDTMQTGTHCIPAA
jgi:hypothetical protein